MEYTVKDMNERPVLIRALSPNESLRKPGCDDCGYPAKVRVFEVGITNNPSSWFWCGTCDIGG